MRKLATHHRPRNERTPPPAQLLCILCFVLLAAQPLVARAGSGRKAAGSADTLQTCKSEPDSALALRACLAIAQDANYTNDDRSLAYANAGYIKLGDTQLDLATTYFNKAIQLDSNSDIGLAGRGNVQFMRGNYDLAVRDAERAIKLNPNDHADAYLVLGTLADRNGDHDARISYVSKAITLAPKFAEAYVIRGDGYLREHKYDLALADFNKAIGLKPSLAGTLKQNFEIVYIERGGLLMRSGNFMAAIDDYTSALQLNPVNARALNDRGDAYNTIGDFNKGIEDLTKSIQIDPTNPYPYLNRGVSQFKAGRNAQALLDLNKAIEIDDKLMLAYFVRGEVHKGRSDFTSALSDFQMALELTPTNDPRYADILSAIESVR